MITAAEAREISKINDLSHVYSLISDAAHRGEYNVKCDAISKGNCEVLRLKGYKVKFVDEFGMYGGSIGVHCEISWRDAE